MALTIADVFERAALDAGLDTIDSGSGDATGDFVLLTAADGVLATLALSNPAFADSTTVGGAASADSDTISPDTGPSPGTIGKFKLQNRANASIVAGTVSMSSGDLLISDDEIPAEAVEVTCTGGLTITLALS